MPSKSARRTSSVGKPHILDSQLLPQLAQILLHARCQHSRLGTRLVHGRGLLHSHSNPLKRQPSIRVLHQCIQLLPQPVRVLPHACLQHCSLGAPLVHCRWFLRSHSSFLLSGHTRRLSSAHASPEQGQEPLRQRDMSAVIPGIPLISQRGATGNEYNRCMLAYPVIASGGSCDRNSGHGRVCASTNNRALRCLSARSCACACIET